MTRIALTNETGHWFDTDKAEHFDESTYFNGQNHISNATGDQWTHQRLYRTTSGRWILNSWSQWQGSSESYEEISNEEAAKWFVRNEHKPHTACAEQYAALEIQ